MKVNRSNKVATTSAASTKPCFYRINKEGYLFIMIFAGLTSVSWIVSVSFGWISFLLTILCVAFFRDPDRVTPTNEDFLISPADGIVQKIDKVHVPEELGADKKVMRVRISIFLNILDVHVNRIPISGKIEKIKYIHGKFFHAQLDKASKDNERNLVVIKMKDRRDVICVQIAGFVARRIVCYPKRGDNVVAGQRYGMIKFGSRVDVYLPQGEVPKVVEGQSVVGGETVLSVFGDRATLIGSVK
jgi:phosphatidylserine decarboxylase